MCHTIPGAKEWKEDVQTSKSILCPPCYRVFHHFFSAGEMQVFKVAKRRPPFQHWEPIYIGTKADPPYDERLTWEGRSG